MDLASLRLWLIYLYYLYTQSKLCGYLVTVRRDKLLFAQFNLRLHIFAQLTVYDIKALAESLDF